MMKAGMEKREKSDSAVKKTVQRKAKPMIQTFWRRGSVRSLIETQTAPLAAAMAAGKPSAQPAANAGQPDADGDVYSVLDMGAEYGQRYRVKGQGAGEGCHLVWVGGVTMLGSAIGRSIA